MNIVAVIFTITCSAAARPFPVISIIRIPIRRFFLIAHLNILGTSRAPCKQDRMQTAPALIVVPRNANVSGVSTPDRPVSFQSEVQLYHPGSLRKVAENTTNSSSPICEHAWPSHP
jgi:hypothetical protein